MSIIAPSTDASQIPHKLETFGRQGGYAAQCLEPGCGEMTLGGFETRTAARDALQGHEATTTPARSELTVSAELAGEEWVVTVPSGDRGAVPAAVYGQWPSSRSGDQCAPLSALARAALAMGFYVDVREITHRESRVVFDAWPLPALPVATWGVVSPFDSLAGDLDTSESRVIGALDVEYQDTHHEAVVSIAQFSFAARGSALATHPACIGLDLSSSALLDADTARGLARLLTEAADFLDELP